MLLNAKPSFPAPPSSPYEEYGAKTGEDLFCPKRQARSGAALPLPPYAHALPLKGAVLFLSRLSGHVSGRKEMRGNEPKEQEKPCQNQRAGSVAPDRPSRKTVPQSYVKGL